MPRVKRVDYPETRIDDAIEAARILADKFHGEASNLDSYAAALGHKSAKSGTFLTKLADIRKWGLIERNALKITPLAQRIIYPKNNEELNKARLDALFNVSLFKKIYDRLEGKRPSEDFWIILQEITGIERSESQKEAKKISKIYKDALDKIKVEEAKPEIERGHPMLPELKEGMFEAAFGDVYIRIPKSKEGVEELEALVPLIKKKVLGKPEKERK